MVVRSYVMQDDILLGILTVRETFNVAAQLRLPSSVTAEQKAAIVDAIINVSSGPCLQLQCHRTAMRFTILRFNMGLSHQGSRHLMPQCDQSLGDDPCQVASQKVNSEMYTSTW